jgi:hypothetical protein
MLPFTHAVLDDDGEVIRKHRWSHREAKWFTDNNPHVIIVKLPKEIRVRENLYELVGECLF